MDLFKKTIITLEKAFDEFQLSNKARNLSPKTIKNYDNGIRYFSQFFNLKKRCKKLNKQIFEQYILYLRENTNTNEISINTYLRDLRTFINYLIKEKYIKPFPIVLPKVDRVMKETYTDTELRKLLKKPDDNATFTEYRNWVISNYLARNR